MRRLIIALTDGLRPDAVTPAVMPSLFALGEAYTVASRARTVRPSSTVAALASLATGVAPDSHGLLHPSFEYITRLADLRPVARVLARRGIPTDVITPELPLGVQPIVWSLASAAGARKVVPAGRRARDTAEVVDRLLDEERGGLLFVYLPDCDRAGHAHGWMSDPYLDAAREVDAAIGRLSTFVEDALLVVLADHGGGGVLHNEHYHAHPLNAHVPLVLAGPGVARRHEIERMVSLLDVSPTVLWWFGAPIPHYYEGRVLTEAFSQVHAERVTAG